MASYDATVLYSAVDKELVDVIVRQLRAFGLSLWWDEDLTASQMFSMTQMEEVFNPSRHVVALLSRHAQNSSWVKQELNLAISLHKRVVPCVIGDLSERPIDVIGGVAEELLTRQFLDLRRREPF